MKHSTIRSSAIAASLAAVASFAAPLGAQQAASAAQPSLPGPFTTGL